MQSDVWGSISDQGVVTHITGGNFAQSSITINVWLRDFLWAQASQVIFSLSPASESMAEPQLLVMGRGKALIPVKFIFSLQFGEADKKSCNLQQLIHESNAVNESRGSLVRKAIPEALIGTN
ncbi:hypothetical protein ACH5RR_013279 [Cinchona calisaya]|uniref:Uncharacterized protein n=1 Tax=Cinchona calisaya TaxID=153742 RepID=A0ABD2ZZP8_9GENT